MELIDSHCHLDFPQFRSDLDQVLERADRAGVKGMVNAGVDFKSNNSTMALAGRFDFITPALGLSPNRNPKDLEAVTLQIWENLSQISAIGEVGLDYHYNKVERNLQLEVFRGFIGLAQETGLPLVIHAREAEKEALKALGGCDVQAVFHCYSGSLDTLEEVLDSGHLVSLATLVCFSAHHQQLAETVPLESLLLETDSPHLSPHRGERNEPAHIRDLAEKIASLKETPLEEVARQTTRNARKIFRF